MRVCVCAIEREGGTARERRRERRGVCSHTLVGVGCGKQCSSSILLCLRCFELARTTAPRLSSSGSQVLDPCGLIPALHARTSTNNSRECATERTIHTAAHYSRHFQAEAEAHGHSTVALAQVQWPEECSRRPQHTVCCWRVRRALGCVAHCIYCATFGLLVGRWWWRHDSPLSLGQRHSGQLRPSSCVAARSAHCQTHCQTHCCLPSTETYVVVGCCFHAQPLPASVRRSLIVRTFPRCRPGRGRG